MFDGITGDAVAMLDSVTGSSPWDSEVFVSAEEYLEANDTGDGEGEEKEENVEEEEEEDLGWIRRVIRKS